mmetsp:Transcript_57385/g.159705  ORF Transcript_57385/g.159705 Transcript_57385/m.159705 type:complete len:212 (-) Transcript_57385:151-786(-)
MPDPFSLTDSNPSCPIKTICHLLALTTSPTVSRHGSSCTTGRGVGRASGTLWQTRQQLQHPNRSRRARPSRYQSNRANPSRLPPHLQASQGLQPSSSKRPGCRRGLACLEPNIARQTLRRRRRRSTTSLQWRRSQSGAKIPPEGGHGPPPNWRNKKCRCHKLGSSSSRSRQLPARDPFPLISLPPSPAVHHRQSLQRRCGCTSRVRRTSSN